MIQSICENELVDCVNIIRESFSTVAEEFRYTAENSPRFIAFFTTKERSKWHL